MALLTDCAAAKPSSAARSFAIDYANNTFTLDGAPFRYVSGTVHYFRVPRSYWGDRLRRLQAMGANVLETYVEWSSHEPEQEQYEFTGGSEQKQSRFTGEPEEITVFFIYFLFIFSPPHGLLCFPIYSRLLLLLQSYR